MNKLIRLAAHTILFISAANAVLVGPEGSSAVWLAALLVVTALNREDDER